jgi:hypothetical protein
MNAEAWRTHCHLVFIIRCLTSVREKREGTLTMHGRRSRQNKWGKKLLELSTVGPKFRIACGFVYPSQANKPCYFRPFFGGRRSETHVSKNAHDVRTTFRFDCRNAAGNPLILPRPSVKRSFQAGTPGVSATSNEVSPPGSRSGMKARCFFQPTDLFVFPAQKHAREQVPTIFEMPIKTSFRGAKLSRKDFHSNCFNTVRRELGEGCLNPIFRLKRRRSYWGRGRHLYSCIRLEDT